jgi:hypothetical protein
MIKKKEPEDFNILIGCEFSGIVRDTFIKEGFTNTISCDLLPSESDKGMHHQGDLISYLQNSPITFDLMIAHPSCQYLTNSGVRWLYIKDKDGNKIIDNDRWLQMEESCQFFNYLLNQPIKHICIENPIMHKHARNRIDSSYQQIIQPYYFGTYETKSTCLWLKNLPELRPTNIITDKQLIKPRVHFEGPSPDRWKNRSRTDKNIAKSMAEQWGKWLLREG